MEDEDDFVELAYFKTWIAVRNTFQQVWYGPWSESA